MIRPLPGIPIGQFAFSLVVWQRAAEPVSIVDPNEVQNQDQTCAGGYQHGSKWFQDYVACWECECKSGTIFCGRASTCCKVPALDAQSPPRLIHDGTTWRNGCSACSCNNGHLTCPSNSCPKVTPVPAHVTINDCPNAYVGEPFDKCDCPQLHCYKGCKVGDREYRHLQSWNDPENGCNKCVCFAGLVNCKSDGPSCSLQKVRCPESGYEATLPGECCPTWLCHDEVPCAMSPWSDWTECSATCGLGTSMRCRHTTKRLPTNEHSKDCPPTSETRNCYLRHCDVVHNDSDVTERPKPTSKPNRTSECTTPPGTVDLSPYENRVRHHHLEESDGCRSVEKIQTKHCGRKRCREFGMHNGPIYQATVVVKMRCPAAEDGMFSTYHNRLFGETHVCGCIHPLANGCKNA